MVVFGVITDRLSTLWWMVVRFQTYFPGMLCVDESLCVHVFSVSDEPLFAPKYFHWLQVAVPFGLRE